MQLMETSLYAHPYAHLASAQATCRVGNQPGADDAQLLWNLAPLMPPGRDYSRINQGCFLCNSRSWTCTGRCASSPRADPRDPRPQDLSPTVCLPVGAHRGRSATRDGVARDEDGRE
jgi:hypothetical protein